jgi:hypothetical protein
MAQTPHLRRPLADKNQSSGNADKGSWKNVISVTVLEFYFFFFLVVLGMAPREGLVHARQLLSVELHCPPSSILEAAFTDASTLLALLAWCMCSWL